MSNDRARAREVKPRRGSARDTHGTWSIGDEVRRRLDWLVSVLGNNEVAHLLGVSRSQPSRWRSGAEGITAHNQRALVDLDYVVVRLHQMWVPDVAAIWLESPNAYLGGATPIDVLRRHGPAALIQAIEAESEGSYA
jgi:hypothetical protein